MNYRIRANLPCFFLPQLLFFVSAIDMKKRRPQYRDEELIKLVAKNVRQARIKLGLTQAELAHNLQIDDSSLRKIESGKLNVTISTLKKLSTQLNINICKLLQ